MRIITQEIHDDKSLNNNEKGKVLHNVHKFRTRLTEHLQKHQGKYFFAAGTAIGLSITKIVAIIAVFVGGAILIGNWSINNTNNTRDIGQASNVFYKINEVANEKITASGLAESATAGYPIPETVVTTEKKLDTLFHNADNLNEQFSATTKMVNFLIERNKKKLIGHIVTGLELEFIELLPIFNQIH